MSNKITIEKQVFEKQQYRQVIKPTFNQLSVGGQTPGTAQATAPTPTIQEFFDSYQELFFQIPKEGETNSHQYLVNQSGDYIGGQAVNEQVLALTQEITNLRQENLELQQQLLDLANQTNE